MLGVLYVRDGRAVARADPDAQTYFYRGRCPSTLYRLRLGMASLLTAEAGEVARLLAARVPVTIEVIAVETADDWLPGVGPRP